MSTTLSNVEKSFVFNFLKNNKVPLEIKTNRSTFKGFIKDYNPDEILLEIDVIPKEITEYRLKLQVFFFFQNSHHIFNSHVLKHKGYTIIIKNPESVVKNLERKHSRYIVDGKYKCTLLLEGELLPLDYPKSRLYYYSDNPPVNADFKDVKIEEMIAKFKQKVSNYVTANKIQMLRNYTPKNFLEKLAITSGKIVFVPNCKTDLVIKNTDEVPQNINRKNDWIEFERELNNTPDNLMNKAISDYMIALKNNNILSIAIIPVLYRDYVVSLITLINDLNAGKCVDYSILKYSDQFARILSYSLKMNGYFKAEEGEKIKYELPIFDISLGGISFSTDNEELEEKLTLDKNIQMILHIKDRNINVLGKIVRKYEKLLHKFYGIMFLNINKDDLDFIDKTFKS